MKIKIGIFAALIVLCLIGGSTSVAMAQATKQQLEKLKGDVLTAINQHRAGIGRKPLQVVPVIVKEAEGHSRNMANKSVDFGHDGFDERSDRIMKKVPHSTASAENVAYGPRTAKAVVDMWLHSPGHKKNIEGDYNLTGIGIASSADGTLYYTQIFIKN
jgi:uncharacterized protein YkwD